MNNTRRSAQDGAFVRSVYAEKLASFLKQKPIKGGHPSFLSGDHSALFFAAVDNKRMLSRTEEDTLISSIVGNHICLFTLALYFLEQEKYGDVLSLLTNITEFSYSHTLRAAIATEKHRIDEALSELQRIVERNDRIHKTWHAIGLAYAAQGKRSKAIFALYRAIRLTPSTEPYFDELLSILGHDDERRTVLASLREKPPAERTRWISPLDELFPDAADDAEVAVDEIQEPVRNSAPIELSALPPLLSIQVVVDVLRNGDDIVEDISFDPGQFLRSKDSHQRAQVAATLFNQASDDWRERIHWLGSYAFAKAEQMPAEDKNHFLLTFLICSYFCNTDVPVRDTAFKRYINNSGSRALIFDGRDAAFAFVRGPSPGTEIWAARLAIALFDALGLGQKKLRQRVIQKLASAFILDSRESESAKIFAIEKLFDISLFADQRRAVSSMLSLVSRAYTMPQARDRMGSIFDLRAYIAREGAILSKDTVDLFNLVIESLDRSVQTDLADSPPAVQVSASVSVDRDGEIIVNVRFANEGTVELRDLDTSLVLADSAPKDLGYRESLAAGEAALFTTSIRGYARGTELKATFQARVGTGVTTLIEQKTVLRIPSEGAILADVENPYYTGMPIPPDDPQMFFGRKQELVQLTNLLANTRVTHIPLVFGQRRTGKTSLLNRMWTEPSIKKAFRFCLLDCERVSGQGTSGFVSYLADEFQHSFDLELNADYDNDAISRDPLSAMRVLLTELSRWGRKGRKALIALDEFEVLLAGIRDKSIDSEILSVFRSFMQHSRDVRFVIAGADELVERVRDYASPLFGLTRPIRVGYLDRLDVADLIMNPIKGSITVDDDILDVIRQLVAGHPHLTQMICHYVVEALNRTGRRRFTGIDVDLAAETIISENDAYFFEIYQGRCSLLDRQILAAAAELAQRHGMRVPYTELYQLLRECGIVLKPEHLQTLQDRQLILFDAQSRIVDFRLELFRRWIVRKYPLEAQRGTHV